MIQNFSKNFYNFGVTGGTQEVTNIFTSIEINLDRPGFLAKDKIENGERPDQLSQRIYNTPNYYDSLLRLNGIKNPLVDWNQSLTINKLASKYSGLAFQFGNVNSFLNTISGITYFGITATDQYDSVDFSDIQVGDTIIYETGGGSYKIRSFGAGGITGFRGLCADAAYFTPWVAPNYGQGIISKDIDETRIIDVFAADGYNALLTDEGYIWFTNGGYRMTRSPGSNGAYPDVTNSVLGITGSGFIKTNLNGYTGPVSLGMGIMKGMILAKRNSNSTLATFGSSGWYTPLPSQIKLNELYPKFIKVANLKRKTFPWLGIGLTLNNELFNVGITGATYTPQFASGVTFTDIDCGQDFCIGLQVSGLTAWSGGGEPASIKASLPTGSDYKAIAAGYFHALALKNDGSVTGWGDNTYGQCDAPAGVSFTQIRAGKYFSVGITDTGKLKTWGRITTYNGYGGITAFGVTLNDLEYPGTYSRVAAGEEHIIAIASGTPQRYVGVITEIDNDLKRIICRDYYNLDQEEFYDTSMGTRISIWRGTNQIKTINNKLIGLQKVLNSPIRIEENGIKKTINSNLWKTSYLPYYSVPQSNSNLITPLKIIEEYVLEQRLDVYLLNFDKIINLDRKIKEKLSEQNKQIKINISEL